MEKFIKEKQQQNGQNNNNFNDHQLEYNTNDNDDGNTDEGGIRRGGKEWSPNAVRKARNDTLMMNTMDDGINVDNVNFSRMASNFNNNNCKNDGGKKNKKGNNNTAFVPMAFTTSNQPLRRANSNANSRGTPTPPPASPAIVAMKEEALEQKDGGVEEEQHATHADDASLMAKRDRKAFSKQSMMYL